MEGKALVPLSIRRVYDGRIFSVAVESVTLHGGERLDVEVVRHPGSVVIVPVDDAGSIVLVRQYRHALGRWLWELPAGGLKPGEDPTQAAARECQEETGYVAANVERLGAFFPTPGYCDEEMNFYLASGLRTAGPGDAPAHPDADEEIEVGTFTQAAIREMVASGDIIDLKTVAGLALATKGY